MPIGQGERWEYDAVERRGNPEAASYERNVAPPGPLAGPILLPSGTEVYYQASPPPAPKPGAIWFNSNTSTACILGAACPGTMGANGVQRVPASHRGVYWSHRWNGSAWESAETTALIISSEIATGAVAAHHITAVSLAAQYITINGRPLSTLGYVHSLLYCRVSDRTVFVGKNAYVERGTIYGTAVMGLVVTTHDSGYGSGYAATVQMTLEGGIASVEVGGIPYSGIVTPVLYVTMGSVAAGRYNSHFYIGLWHHATETWIDPNNLDSSFLLKLTALGTY